MTLISVFCYPPKKACRSTQDALFLEADEPPFPDDHVVQEVDAEELDGLSDQVRAFCAHVAERLDEFDFDEKRLALEALQIKVVVGRDGAKLFGAIPADLATTGRTWA